MRIRILFAASAFLLIGLILLSLCVGAYPLAPRDIPGILAGNAAGSMAERVFFRLRLPRTLMAVLAGAALSLSGGVYQLIFRNPLASPDLTGVASGAACGAACAILFASGSMAALMSGAFIGGILSLICVLLLVRTAGSASAGTYVLAGVIISAAADAALMALKITADPEKELAAIEFWTMGSLASVTADKLTGVLGVLLLPMIFLLLFSRQAAMLSLPDEDVRPMGLHPGRWRCILAVLSTLCTASVIAVTGVIAFAGLIAPHIAYRLYGRRSGAFLPLCTILGGILILAADLPARSLSSGAELPLSIFTVIIAAPTLAFILCRRGRMGGYRNEL